MLEALIHSEIKVLFVFWERKNGLTRPILTDSVVHGIKLKPHLGYYPEQIEAYKALIKHLCDFYNIPMECPRGDDGKLLTGVDPLAAKAKFNGIVNHYNITRKKIDTAGLKLDEIVDELK